MSKPLRVTQAGDYVRFTVKVKPRASRDEVVGLLDDMLAVRLKAPPVDGAANKALCRFLAKQLCIKASDITILSGQTGRNKIIQIQNISAKKIHRLYRS